MQDVFSEITASNHSVAGASAGILYIYVMIGDKRSSLSRVQIMYILLILYI